MTLNEHDPEHRDDDAPPPTPDAYGAPLRRKRRWGVDDPPAGEGWGDDAPVVTSPADFGLGVWPPPKKLATPEELEAEFLEPSSTKGETT